MTNRSRRVACLTFGSLLASWALVGCSDSAPSQPADAGKDAPAVPDAAAPTDGQPTDVAAPADASGLDVAAADAAVADRGLTLVDGVTLADGAGIPNPASVNCQDKGGSLDIRANAGGQYGVCKFKDGSECEEWAFYRGECRPGDCATWETCAPTLDAGRAGDGSPVVDVSTVGPDGKAAVDRGAGLADPSAVHCLDTGGSLDIRTDESGGQYAVCRFKDGTECDTWAYFRGQCNPGDCAIWEACQLPLDGGTPIDGGAPVDAGAIVEDAAAALDRAGIANPASVYCEDNGGSLDIRTDDVGGQVGVCKFKDGSECEEWSYLRGECKPGDCATWDTCPPILDGGVIDGDDRDEGGG